jgi:hypothetical protein
LSAAAPVCDAALLLNNEAVQMSASDQTPLRIEVISFILVPPERWISDF